MNTDPLPPLSFYIQQHSLTPTRKRTHTHTMMSSQPSLQHPDPAARQPLLRKQWYRKRDRVYGEREKCVQRNRVGLPPLLCLPITLGSHGHGVLSLPYSESWLIIDDNVPALMYMRYSGTDILWTSPPWTKSPRPDQINPSVFASSFWTRFFDLCVWPKWANERLKVHMHSKQTAADGMYPQESMLSVGTVPSVQTAGGELGFSPGPSHETLVCCIYRRTVCIFNAEERMEPLETVLLRHEYYTRPLTPSSGWCLIC